MRSRRSFDHATLWYNQGLKPCTRTGPGAHTVPGLLAATAAQNLMNATAATSGVIAAAAPMGLQPKAITVPTPSAPSAEEPRPAPAMAPGLNLSKAYQQQLGQSGYLVPAQYQAPGQPHVVPPPDRNGASNGLQTFPLSDGNSTLNSASSVASPDWHMVDVHAANQEIQNLVAKLNELDTSMPTMTAALADLDAQVGIRKAEANKNHSDLG